MTGSSWAMVSELAVDPAGAQELEAAFRDRLGEVDGWPGFERLEVWRDPRRDGRYLMVSWWTDREAFSRWMQSDAHRRSHDRVPSGSARPRPVSFERFEVIAT